MPFCLISWCTWRWTWVYIKLYFK